jgi:hypothetical protein
LCATCHLLVIAGTRRAAPSSCYSDPVIHTDVMRGKFISSSRQWPLRGTAGRRRDGAPARSLAAGAIVAGLLFAALIGSSASRAAEPASIAIAKFDYVDTSGEVQDQTDKHAALIAEFMQALGADLGRGAKFRLVSLLCDGQPCAAGADRSELIPRARAAGAKLLLFGGIHKQSTLVQWAKVEVVDLDRDKLVYDRLLTFRGDDANAWRRAEEFLARDLQSANLAQ